MPQTQDFTIPQPMLYPIPSSTSPISYAGVTQSSAPDHDYYHQPQIINQPQSPQSPIQQEPPQTSATSGPKFLSGLTGKKKFRLYCFIALTVVIIVGSIVLYSLWVKKKKAFLNASGGKGNETNQSFMSKKWQMFKNKGKPSNYNDDSSVIRDEIPEMTKAQRMKQALYEAHQESAKMARQEAHNDRLIPDDQAAIPSFSAKFKDEQYRKLAMQQMAQQAQQQAAALQSQQQQPSDLPLSGQVDAHQQNSEDPNGAPLD